jgi:hypothetical protein
MKLNKKQLPFYAATVQTIQYAVAGYLLLSWVGAFSVGTMGALVSLSMAYASSQVSSEMAKSRKTQSYLALAGLMVLSPVIVGTATFYSLSIVTNPIWRGIVAGVWGIIPDGAVALAGFVAGKGMMGEQPKHKKSKAKQKKAEAKAKQAVQVPAPPAFVCATCGFEAKSQKALNGHQLKHKPIAYSVSLVEPITSDKITMKEK